jgi:hypothetical protein
MGILSRATIIAALFTGASALHAFEQRTIWFNVPYTVSLWQTTPPTFPPATGPAADWNTFVQTDAVTLGLPGSPVLPGLRLPTIGEVFTGLTVPAELQGDLVSVSLSISTHIRSTWEFTSDNGQSGTADVTTEGTLTVYDIVSPAPSSFDPAPTLPAGVLLTDTLSINRTGIVPAAGPLNLSGTDTELSIPVSLTGANLTAFDAASGFVALPIEFFTTAFDQGSGNYDTVSTTWSAVRVGVTYTFLPESNWAWAGLPMVFGVWAIRRRMTNAKAA